MNDPLQVEPVGEHDYLIRVHEGEQTVEFRIRATPGVLLRLGVDESQERQLVTATAMLLTERQLAIDLPPILDLDDVAASYDDYLDEIGKRLE